MKRRGGAQTSRTSALPAFSLLSSPAELLVELIQEGESSRGRPSGGESVKPQLGVVLGEGHGRQFVDQLIHADPPALGQPAQARVFHFW
jgi:hypothetical protein